MTDLPDMDEVLSVERSHPEYWEVICEHGGGPSPNVVQVYCDHHDELDCYIEGTFSGCDMVRVHD